MNPVKSNSVPTESDEGLSKPLRIGVIYLAYGKKYCEEAIKSAQSFKRYNKGIPITVHTDFPKMMRSYRTLFSRVVGVPRNPGKYKTAPYAKLKKIKAMSTFPYDITLYLDCDTIIRGSIKELFTKAKNHDILIANSPWLDKTKTPFKLVKYARPRAYNSGVIVYRKTPIMIKLFESWQRLANSDRRALAKIKGKFYDQPKLVTILNQPNFAIDLKVIPNTVYNCRHTMVQRVKKDKLFGKVKILHAH